MKRILVCGSRNFAPPEVVPRILTRLYGTGDPIEIEIVSGGAKGVDTLAEQWAINNQLPFKLFVPDWSIGRHAGMLRNTAMLDYIEQYHSKLVIAFWDKESRGTKDTISKARSRGIPVMVITI